VERDWWEFLKFNSIHFYTLWNSHTSHFVGDKNKYWLFLISGHAELVVRGEMQAVGTRSDLSAQMSYSHIESSSGKFSESRQQ
jgi:hypothetical protein